MLNALRLAGLLTFLAVMPSANAADVSGNWKGSFDFQGTTVALTFHLTATADAAGQAGEVEWNFEKFLVAPSGAVLARFRPTVAPDDEQLVDQIEQVGLLPLRAVRCEGRPGAIRRGHVTDARAGQRLYDMAADESGTAEHDDAARRASRTCLISHLRTDISSSLSSSLD